MAKEFKTRIMHKHEKEEDWNKAEGFMPLQGELIVYDPDEHYTFARIKMGDGKNYVKDLPFIGTMVWTEF